MKIDYNKGISLDFRFRHGSGTYMGSVSSYAKMFHMDKVDMFYGDYEYHLKTEVESNWSNEIVVMLLAISDWFEENTADAIDMRGVWDYYGLHTVFRFGIPWWWDLKDDFGHRGFEEGVIYYGEQKGSLLIVEDMFGNRQCVEHDLFMPVVLKDPIGRFDKYRVEPVKMKRSGVLAIKGALSRHEAFNKEYLSEL